MDLPAPFSPMMPWIVPGMTRIEMSLFACTGPKALEIPRNSMAGAGATLGAAISGRPPISVALLIQNLSTGQVSSDI